MFCFISKWINFQQQTCFADEQKLKRIKINEKQSQKSNPEKMISLFPSLLYAMLIFFPFINDKIAKFAGSDLFFSEEMRLRRLLLGQIDQRVFTTPARTWNRNRHDETRSVRSKPPTQTGEKKIRKHFLAPDSSSNKPQNHARERERERDVFRFETTRETRAESTETEKKKNMSERKQKKKKKKISDKAAQISRKKSRTERTPWRATKPSARRRAAPPSCSRPPTARRAWARRPTRGPPRTPPPPPRPRPPPPQPPPPSSLSLQEKEEKGGVFGLVLSLVSVVWGFEVKKNVEKG